jgi:hypothetical protein
MKAIISAAALVLAMTGSEQATGGILGGAPTRATNQYIADCWYMNQGTAAVTPTAQQIFSFDNGSVQVATSCPNGTPIGAGKMCYLETTKPLDANPYACQLNFSTAPTNVRGSFVLYDSSLNVLSVFPLR